MLVQHAVNSSTASQPEISETVRTFTDPEHTTDMITDHVTSKTIIDSHHSVSKNTTQTDPLMNTEIEFITENIETTSATPDRLTVIHTSGSSTNAHNHETSTEHETASIEISLKVTDNSGVGETTTRFENDLITDVMTTWVTFGELSATFSPITMVDQVFVSSDFTTNMSAFETTIETVSADSSTSEEKGEW